MRWGSSQRFTAFYRPFKGISEPDKRSVTRIGNGSIEFPDQRQLREINGNLRVREAEGVISDLPCTFCR